MRFDDWFPMLQRTAKWNGWSDKEALLQLAGHLRKRALLEWNLLGEAHKTTLSTAVTTLRERLDPGSRSTAVQYFRHARQRESEPVGDFILRVERIFRSAYGRDNLSDDEEIRQIRLDYQGSKPRHARVEVQGVPAHGIVDSGADITIIGGDLFRQVAAVARLKKRDLKRADREPRTYDQRPFALDGRMDLDISFADAMMKTPVYIKMDAHTPLLLSEGVCRQLGIITYHPDICPKEKDQSSARAKKRSEEEMHVRTAHPHQDVVVDAPKHVPEDTLTLQNQEEIGERGLAEKMQPAPARAITNTSPSEAEGDQRRTTLPAPQNRSLGEEPSTHIAENECRSPGRRDTQTKGDEAQDNQPTGVQENLKQEQEPNATCIPQEQDARQRCLSEQTLTYSRGPSEPPGSLSQKLAERGSVLPTLGLSDNVSVKQDGAFEAGRDCPTLRRTCPQPAQGTQCGLTPNGTTPSDTMAIPPTAAVSGPRRSTVELTLPVHFHTLQQPLQVCSKPLGMQERKSAGATTEVRS